MFNLQFLHITRILTCFILFLHLFLNEVTAQEKEPSNLKQIKTYFSGVNTELDSSIDAFNLNNQVLLKIYNYYNPKNTKSEAITKKAIAIAGKGAKRITILAKEKPLEVRLAVVFTAEGVGQGFNANVIIEASDGLLEQFASSKLKQIESDIVNIHLQNMSNDLNNLQVELALAEGVKALWLAFKDVDFKKVNPLRITDVEKDFAPGIDDDHLKMKYEIKLEEGEELKQFKIEIFKKGMKTPSYIDAITDVNGEYQWDGKMNQGGDMDKYIRYSDDTFRIVLIAITKDSIENTYTDTAKKIINPLVDEFLDNIDIVKYIDGKTLEDKFVYYDKLRKPLFSEITSSFTTNEAVDEFENPLKYFNDNVHKDVFLGRTIMVHKNYYPYLALIDKDLQANYGKRFVLNSNYTFGGFSIRFQYGSATAVSNHAYGMALDVTAANNPYLSKRVLFILELLMDKVEIFENKLSVDELVELSNKLKKTQLIKEKVNLIKSGFYVLATSRLSSKTVADNIKSIFNDFENYNTEYIQFSNRIRYLRNERFLFFNKSQSEILDIENELYEELPIKIKNWRDAILSKYSKENLTDYQSFICEGLNKSYRLSALFSEYSQLERMMNDIADLCNVINASQSLIDACERIESNAVLPSSQWKNVEEFGQINYTESIGTIFDYIAKKNKRYVKAFGTSYQTIVSFLKHNIHSFSLNKQVAVDLFYEELSRTGFMNLEKDFIEAFLRSEYAGKIHWGGNYDSHKDFMHIEYVENGKFD